MNHKFKFLKSITLASLLMPLSLLAINDEEEHVSVGSRRSTPISTEENREEAHCGYIFDRYPPVYAPSSMHWFTSVSALGDSAVIEDGSVWLLSTYEGTKALQWTTNDPNFVIPLSITQNFSWFSNYRYRIVNKSTGESIPANLHLGPLKDNPNALFISALDPANRIVILNNNKRFEVSANDLSTFQKFASFDYIIVGQNGGWSSNYEYILINVNMDSYVHAKEF